MGVSGVGKTTIGRRLANDLGWRFCDGDDYHPPANVDKMRRGIALTDEDRDAWLTTLEQLIQQLINESQSAILTCSALKQTYRDRLIGNRREVVLVYLKGSYELIRQRLLSRKEHFMRADLLSSQFETLGEPQGVLVVETDREPDFVVNHIKQALGLSPA